MTGWIEELGIVCALGADKASVAAALMARTQAPLSWRPIGAAPHPMPVGAVATPLPALPGPTPPAQRSRNNQLLYAAALQIEPAIRAAIEHLGNERIGVVLGTSTSGIAESGAALLARHQTGHLPADYHYAQQELASPAAFLSDWLGISGPSYAISTACTSGARALLSARRLLRMGLCDAVICGGVDSLCELTLQGFAALEAVSATTCQPFSAHRDGINIGEGAALFLMTRAPSAPRHTIALLGGGASSDAHHISAPDPTGGGAEIAMRQALRDAQLTADAIGYINLHGTATRHNDAMESRVTHALFGAAPASSTKPLTGHTLGAAGAIEAGFCWLTLSDWNPARRLPPHHWDAAIDTELAPLSLVAPGSHLREGKHLMSNSFAFGGNNISLILGAAPC